MDKVGEKESKTLVMGWFRSTRVLILFLFASLLVTGYPAAAQSVNFEKDSLTIFQSDGTAHRFAVELATEPVQQAQGLMFRKRLGEDEGMLFVYRPAARAVMWMKNTYVSLDMVFIAEGGRIVRIAEKTTPLSTKTIDAGQAVAGVLELKAGTVERLGIKVGDIVRHTLLQ